MLSTMTRQMPAHTRDNNRTDPQTFLTGCTNKTYFLILVSFRYPQQVFSPCKHPAIASPNMGHLTDVQPGTSQMRHRGRVRTSC